MYNLERLKKQIKENSEEHKNKNFVPITIVPNIVNRIKFIPNPSLLRCSARYRDLFYLNNRDLIDTHVNKYFYNASICVTEEGYRLFYRVGKEPKGYEDKIATCLLDLNFNVLPSSNRYLDVHSNWEESMVTLNLKEIVPYRFVNGTHVEDPRAILFNNHWFVFYTDGVKMGVVKLTLDCLRSIYSHYLTPISSAYKKGTREKNWIPFVSESTLYILYSDNPRTVFTCVDNGDCLTIVRSLSKNSNPGWDYGDIRGGCPPVIYDTDHLIWFFHSQKKYNTILGEKSVYTIGAYLSENKYPFEFKKITSAPILSGIPSEISETLSLQDYVVFPCGCIKTDTGWKLSMGINDYEIAFLDITQKHLFWKKETTVTIYKKSSIR